MNTQPLIDNAEARNRMLAAQAASPLDLPTPIFTEALERRKANRAALLTWIRSALVEGTDYGRIHSVGKKNCELAAKGRVRECADPAHYSKPSLFKPGAEKICGMLGMTVHFPTLSDYEAAALAGTEIKTIILRCQLQDASGRVVAEGVGARNVAQDYGDFNKALKMAEKCLGGRTPVLIRTENGEVRTDIHRMSLLTGDLERGTLHIAGPNGSWRQVKRIEKQLVALTYRLTFQSGLTVTATGDHRWPLENDELVRTESLKVGDVIKTSRLPAGQGKAMPAFGWMVGLFLAQGTMDEDRGIHFYIHGNHHDIADRLGYLAELIGAGFHDWIDGNRRTVSLRGHSAIGIIKRFIDGRLSYGKRLSRFAWRQNREFLEEILMGYLQGDGGYAEREGRQPFWELGFTGKNRELADDLRTLAAILGYRLRLAPGQAKCNGKVFSAYRGWLKTVDPKYNGKPLGEIIAIEQSEQPTYEIEVDGDHLFCLANGLVTHNSSQVDATLRMAGLSEIFTQDLETMQIVESELGRDKQSQTNNKQSQQTKPPALATRGQLGKLAAMIRSLDLDAERVAAWCKAKWGVEKAEDLTFDQWRELVGRQPLEGGEMEPGKLHHFRAKLDQEPLTEDQLQRIGAWLGKTDILKEDIAREIGLEDLREARQGQFKAIHDIVAQKVRAYHKAQYDQLPVESPARS